MSAENRLTPAMPSVGSLDIPREGGYLGGPASCPDIDVKKVVLVVDDTEMPNLRMYNMALSKLDLSRYDVRLLKSGESVIAAVNGEAFEYASVNTLGKLVFRLGDLSASQRPPQLIVMDMEMPGRNGLESAREIRALEGNYGWGKKIHIVLSSGTISDEASQPEEHRAVFDGFWSKDVKMSVMKLKERFRVLLP